MTKIQTRLAILIILLIGFVLRVYQLGNDSYWNDEAGQLLAALEPTFSGMMVIIKGHVHAMPLDYFVTRGISRIGIAEIIIRYPAVIWGTLNIVVIFALAKLIFNDKTALIAALLVSISVTQIHFSQEARFYSSLAFFYSFGLLLLFQTLKQPKFLNWLFAIFIIALGSYFQPFALLCLIPIWVYAFLLWLNGEAKKTVLSGLAWSTALIGLIHLPGYLYFGGANEYPQAFLSFGESFLATIGSGLGLYAIPYQANSIRFGAWETVAFIFTVVGLAHVIRNFWHNKFAVSILLGITLQIAIIALGVAWSEYWFISRHILYLNPHLLIFMAIGLTISLDFLFKRSRQPPKSKFQFATYVGVCLIFLFLSLPRVQDYYLFEKSNSRQISAQIAKDYESEYLIYVMPAHDTEVYEFYLNFGHGINPIAKNLIPIAWEQIAGIVATENDIYLITPSNLSEVDLNYLHKNNFSLLYEPKSQGPGTRILFIRTFN